MGVRPGGATRTTRATIPGGVVEMYRLTTMLVAPGVPVGVIAQPTSLTWVGMQATVDAGGGRFYLNATKHSARLRPPAGDRTSAAPLGTPGA